MRKTNRPSGNKITILILSILVLVACLGGVYEFFFKPFNAALHNKAWGEDAERSSKLYSYVLSRVPIGGNSLSSTNQAPVEMQPSRKATRMDLFGVTNFDCQEQICMAVKEWQSTNTELSRVHVRFFATEKPRGEYGQHIETLLREELIVLTNAQSGVIFNQAATKN